MEVEQNGKSEQIVERSGRQLRINFKIALFHLLLHIALVYTVYLMVKTHIHPLTYLWTFHLFVIGGIGTGISPHRYFTHKSFKATKGFRWFLLYCQQVAGQDSVYHWVTNHRVHHKCTDTDGDVANINRGFFFAYVGNYFLPRHPDCLKEWERCDVSDIEADPVLMFQFRYYELLWAIFSIGIPTLVPHYLWGETIWVGFWMNLFRYSINFSHLNVSNTINHMFGQRPYDAKISATENTFAVYWTFGEGYHNFHHAFPLDYKGMEYESYGYFNISTVMIDWFAKCGWVYDLKTTPKESIINRVNRTGDGTHHSLKKHSD